MPTPPMDDDSRSLIPLPDGSLANTMTGARRIVSAMVGEMLSIAQSVVPLRASALGIEIARLEHELDQAGESEGLFDPEISVLIMQHGNAVTALEAITWQQPTSFEVQRTEAEVTKFEQQLEEIGDDENLFDPKTAVLVKQYHKALATLEAANRQKKPPAEADSLRSKMSRLEGELVNAADGGQLFNSSIARLIIEYSRAVAELGDVSCYGEFAIEAAKQKHSALLKAVGFVVTNLEIAVYWSGISVSLSDHAINVDPRQIARCMALIEKKGFNGQRWLDESMREEGIHAADMRLGGVAFDAQQLELSSYIPEKVKRRAASLNTDAPKHLVAREVVRMVIQLRYGGILTEELHGVDLCELKAVLSGALPEPFERHIQDLIEHFPEITFVQRPE